ncbi:MAG: GTPase ObgE [Oscillospiraceae bacterium]|nr:GTPase ObgE [Oscillospiraceae bacterium]
MFIDIANIYVKAGKGGDGAVSFHRERCVTSGGPDGGDGGKGGDVILKVDNNLSTLINFKYKKRFIAQDGRPGGKKRCFGKSGENIIIKVPRGTLVKNAETGKVIVDMTNKDEFVIAKGGSGGWGNRHFATPEKQAPRFSKPGLDGQELNLSLELKLLADVGLVGFPNVGKSTFVSVVSEAKPKIANYHFTTLVPVLGVVKLYDESSFVIADIPGLIEGASDGVGLGHEFLRHIDRCRLILHVVDVSGLEGRDPIEDFKKINLELKKFNQDLSQRPQIVVANKCDIAESSNINRFKNYIKNLGYEIFEISAVSNKGVKELINFVSKKLSELPPIREYEPEEEILEEIEVKNNKEFEITKEIVKDEVVYIVKATWLFNILKSVNLEDNESLYYFQKVIKTSGIESQLQKMGINDGDTVKIFNLEFEYIK